MPTVKATTADEAIERVKDRALFELVHWLMPNRLTRGGTERPRTKRERQANREIYDTLLAVLTDLEPRRGEAWWHDQIVNTGLSRGVIVRGTNGELVACLRYSRLAPYYVTQEAAGAR